MHYPFLQGGYRHNKKVTQSQTEKEQQPLIRVLRVGLTIGASDGFGGWGIETLGIYFGSGHRMHGSGGSLCVGILYLFFHI